MKRIFAFALLLSLMSVLVLKPAGSYAGEKPDTGSDFLAAEARIHDKQGSFDRQMERWALAEQQFARAIALQTPLVRQFPDSAYYVLWMATFRIAHADALTRRDQFGEARRELEEAIAALVRQTAQRPDIPPPHDLLALAYAKLATALRRDGAEAAAAEAARKADQERNLVRRSP